MAKIRGYKVIGTTSTSKAAVGKATGVDELIVLGEAPGTSYEDYTTVDVVKRVMEITKGEVRSCTNVCMGATPILMLLSTLWRSPREKFVSCMYVCVLCM